MTTKADIDLIQSFDLACAQSGVSHKAVAVLMGMSRQQLYQSLRKDRPLSLVRLIQMKDDADGRKFLRCYWPLVGDAMGLSEFADGIRVADALQAFINNVQCRMVKATLVERELAEEKRSA